MRNKSGESTYRPPDMAYHREKFRRGFGWMVNVFGADHIATVPDVLAGVRALGYDDTKIKVVLHQFVTLLREGRQVKMSTRKATFITLDELLAEVGANVLRFFYLMRKSDSQLEFDLDLARSRARRTRSTTCSTRTPASAPSSARPGSRGSSPRRPRQRPSNMLREQEEFALLKVLADYPALVAGAAVELAPHRVIFYLMNLAGQFHSYARLRARVGKNGGVGIQGKGGTTGLGAQSAPNGPIQGEV